jgi:hypothetical protein
VTNTPKTDAACGWPWGQHGRIESGDLLINVDGPFVHAAVARELERENAALREEVSIRDAEIDMWASRCAAAIYMLPEAVTGGQLKEAQNKFYLMLEKARKEAQP